MAEHLNRENPAPAEGSATAEGIGEGDAGLLSVAMPSSAATQAGAFGPEGDGATDEGDDLGVSRRELLRRAGIGGGAVLAAGMLAASPVLAQTPVDPDPSRTGRTPNQSSPQQTLATKEYVDARVLRSGDTMTGDLLFSAQGGQQTRQIGTSSAHHFDLVSAGQPRLRLTATGDIEANVGDFTVSSDGVQRLHVGFDGTTRLASGAAGAHLFELSPVGQATVTAAALSLRNSSGQTVFSVDAATGASTLAGPLTIPDLDPEEGPGEHAANRSFVEDRFSKLRRVPVAQGGLRSDGVFEEVFFENDVRVTANHTIGVRYDNEGNPTEPYGGERVMNAMTAGPITVAAETVITVPEGSVWTIV